VTQQITINKTADDGALLARIGAIVGSVVREEMRGASVASAASPFGPAIDAYRALLDEGMPRKAAALFQALLDAPATPLAPGDIFRIKVNLGLCRWLLDDKTEAARLIEEGCDAAPTEPKAIANRALVLMLRGKANEAFEYAKRELDRAPDSELLASHLYRIALELGEVDEPIGLIPPDLQKTESVLLLRTLFLRNREVRPLWWEVAAESSKRFPANKAMALFAAEAVVDRNVNANLGRGWLTASEAERPAIEQALLVLEASWERIKSSENPDADEGSAILNTQMMAKRLLADRDGALAIARGLIHRPVQPKLLTNAAQIALTFDDDELADACLAKLPSGGDFDYFRGVLALSRGLWGEAARHFKVAEYPEEDAPLVAAVLRLAPVAESRDPVQADELESLGADDDGDARVPVLLATVARRRGLDDLAKRSFERAVRMLRDDSGMPERIMVAVYAERAGEFGTLVDVLSGHVETAVLSAELQQLADGHAGEQPRKKRNRKFFEDLPAEVRQANGIARAYATVLLDAREYQKAEGVFRQVIASRPDDAYSHLRLVDTLRRQDDGAGVRAVVQSADERLFLDQPRLAAQWALLLRDADEPSRALVLAYELVRRHPDNAKVALGYIGLILGGRNFDSILDARVCGQDCFVALTSARGERHEFVIDEGGSILGIEAVSAGSDRARRVLGLAVDAQLEEESLDGQPHVWTLSALASKYLHVLHLLMNQFQIRYPGSEGIRRLDMVDGKITPLLDWIRIRSDAVREGVFDLYVNKKLPLVLVGRALGGDEMWLAQRIREFRLNIETCSGAPAETAAALALMTESRGAGAVLDAYTSWVCADMGLLEGMRSWFGSLFLSQSVIDKIDQLIASEQAVPGREALSLSWLDASFSGMSKTGTPFSATSMRSPALRRSCSSVARSFRLRCRMTSTRRSPPRCESSGPSRSRRFTSPQSEMRC
jgi:tetratricopeptide (TPR) repeat protein